MAQIKLAQLIDALGVVDSPPTTVPEAAVDATIEAVGRMVDAATDALGAVNRAARRRRAQRRGNTS